MKLTQELVDRAANGESVKGEILADPELYAQVYLQIQTKAGGLVPLAYNRSQQILHEKCEQFLKEDGKIRIVLLKARQFGGSTYIGGRIFHKTATAFNQHSKIITHDAGSAVKMLSLYNRFYNLLEADVQPMVKYQSKSELAFSNPTKDPATRLQNPGLQSSLGVYTAKTIGAGRGSTIRHLHCSEVAHWDDAKTTMLGLMNAVPGTGADSLGTEVFLESTANGVGDYFYNKYKSAKRRELGEEFRAIFIPWYVHTEYSVPAPDGFLEELNKVERDLYEEEHEGWEYVNEETGRKTLSLAQLHWRRIAIATLCDHDDNLFRQEYPLTDDEAFIASGQNFFDLDGIQKRMEFVQKEVRPVFVGDLEWKKIKGVEGRRKQEVVLLNNEHNGCLTIWHQPEKGESYVYFADVGEGVRDSDFSVVDILRRKDGVQCAQWRGRIDPDKFGDVIFDLGHYFNWAYGTPETNNHGLTTILRLRYLRYPSVFQRLVYDKGLAQAQEKEGWSTSARTRPLMLDALRKMFRDDEVVINSLVTLEEMKTFVKERNKFQAQDGCFDDCVMTMAGACQMLTDLPKPGRSKIRSWGDQMEMKRPKEPKYDRHTGAVI